MTATFRPAAPDDVAVILPMMRVFYAHEGIRFDDAGSPRTLAQLIGDSSLGRCWLIEDGGAAIGYTALVFGFSLEFLGRDAFLDEVYVMPDHRGHGLGSRAIDVAEEACRTLGIRALHLEVERANTRAQELYRRRGFVDHDRYLLTRWL